MKSEPISSWPDTPPTSQPWIAPLSTPDFSQAGDEFGSMSPEKVRSRPFWKPPLTPALNLTIAPSKPPLLALPVPVVFGSGFGPGRK